MALSVPTIGASAGLLGRQEDASPLSSAVLGAVGGAAVGADLGLPAAARVGQRAEATGAGIGQKLRGGHSMISSARRGAGGKARPS
jgi:hypothetical protein